MSPAPITASLAAITSTWPQLLADTYAIHGALGSGMPGAAKSPALPGGTARLSAIADTTRVLAAWALVVVTDRADHHALATEHLTTDVPGLCHWLRPHTDWLEDTTAGAAADEIAQVADHLTALVSPGGIRRPVIGPCVLTDPNGQPCDGAIRGYLDTDHTESADLACDLDPDHRWIRDHWVDLSLAIARKVDPNTEPLARYVTTEKLAQWLSTRFRRRVSVDLIWKWTEIEDGFRLYKTPDGWDRIAVTHWHMDRFPQHAPTLTRA